MIQAAGGFHRFPQTYFFDFILIHDVVPYYNKHKRSSTDTNNALIFFIQFCIFLTQRTIISHCFTNSYSTTNKMHLLSKIINFCKTLYMFGRSFRLLSGAQNCVYSNGICQTAAATCCSR